MAKTFCIVADSLMAQTSIHMHAALAGAWLGREAFNSSKNFETFDIKDLDVQEFFGRDAKVCSNQHAPNCSINTHSCTPTQIRIPALLQGCPPPPHLHPTWQWVIGLPASWVTRFFDSSISYPQGLGVNENILKGATNLLAVLKRGGRPKPPYHTSSEVHADAEAKAKAAAAAADAKAKAAAAATG
eukprot:6214758-Pleurochrysis_carterae.AAC.2